MSPAEMAHELANARQALWSLLDRVAGMPMTREDRGELSDLARAADQRVERVAAALRIDFIDWLVQVLGPIAGPRRFRAEFDEGEWTVTEALEGADATISLRCYASRYCGCETEGQAIAVADALEREWRNRRPNEASA